MGAWMGAEDQSTPTVLEYSLLDAPQEILPSMDSKTAPKPYRRIATFESTWLEPELEFLQSDSAVHFITWDGLADPNNPQNWSPGRKWLVSLTCIVSTFSCLFSCTAPTMAGPRIQLAFEINDLTEYSILTVFLVGLIFGPLFWGPGSELYGRQPILIGCMIMFTLSHLGQALCRNIQTLLICRFLSGFFGTAPVAVGGGLIPDIWAAEGRSPVIGLYIASVFLGPVFGPVASGFIVSSSATWRWVFWMPMIFAGASTVFLMSCIRETYAPLLLRRKLQKLRQEHPLAAMGLSSELDRQDWSLKGVIIRTLYRPLEMLSRELILVLVTVYIAVLFGVLFALFEAIPIIFIEHRGFTFSQNGLVFLGVGFGVLLGCVVGKVTARHYPALSVKWQGFPPPEQRLFGAMVGGPCLVIGSFLLGWTGQDSGIHWIAPVIGTVFIGISICSIFISFIKSYLVDVYLTQASSAIAANSFVRSAVAATFPLFTTQMFRKLGIAWASTLLGILGLVLAPIPFLFYKFGTRIRRESKFAACMDLKIGEQLGMQELKLAHRPSEDEAIGS